MKNAGGIKLTNYKVAISLREDLVNNRDEFRDSYDIGWKKTIEELVDKQILMFPITNHAESVCSILNIVKPDFIILSGGEDTERRHAAEREIIKYSLKRHLPILVLNEYFGGSSTKLEGHVKTFHQVYSAYASDYNHFTVNSFHNFGIEEDKLGKGLKPLWKDQSGHIEAYKGKDHKILGIMWHPERYKETERQSQEWLSSYLKDLIT